MLGLGVANVAVTVVYVAFVFGLSNRQFPRCRSKPPRSARISCSVSLGAIDASRRTPVVALRVNMGIGVAAIAIGRTDEIIVLSVFGALSLYLFASACVLRLRATEPALARPYRTPFYPLPPRIAIGLGLMCLAAMVLAAWLGLRRLVPAERRRTSVSG